MGFMKHFRSKTRLKEEQAQSFKRASNPARGGRDFTDRLPEDILIRIFSEVCPHTLDRSYLPSEQSTVGEGCMLCDLRDLAQTARVSRRWYSLAQDLLYSSVRIDAVHYCELEEKLAEQRKRKSFLKSSVATGDIPTIRLTLFSRTVRDSQPLATRVELLKLPYMTRETCKNELASTVSMLPNLQYVDLPDGISTGDPSCQTLLLELQARCPDIRSISYRNGAEASFELLAKRHWQNLQILELSDIAVEPSTLRIVLASLPTLHELTLINLPWLDDSIFLSSPVLPEFPPLQCLSLENIPLVTAGGLKTYLSHPQNRAILASLTLNNVGVLVTDLHKFLFSASQITKLAIFETVEKSIALNLMDMPPLASITLQTLHYEVTDGDEARGLQRPSSSYYAYLARSLHSSSLPALRELFVRDPTFPELLLAPPPDLLASPNPASTRPRKTFNQTLEVFSKGLDELDWVFTAITPPAGHNRSSTLTGGRPLSAYSASRGLGPQWATNGDGARKSVMVGNGFGGFLAVPAEDGAWPSPRPTSSHSSRSSPNPSAQWGSPQVGGMSPSMASLSLKESNRSENFLKALTPSIGSGSGGSRISRGNNHDIWR